jgi:hypothetical protein
MDQRVPIRRIGVPALTGTPLPRLWEGEIPSIGPLE